LGLVGMMAKRRTERIYDIPLISSRLEHVRRNYERGNEDSDSHPARKKVQDKTTNGSEDQTTDAHGGEPGTGQEGTGL
jgi:hypothetical protein